MITIDLLELDGYFDVKVFREATERAKPHGDPLIEAARRAGITDMSRVLYVGDAVPDVLSAHDAGADFALVSWTKMPREELDRLGPDYIIEVPEQLPCIIKGSEL
jgi:pyrophosphatase PpaX